MQVHAITIQGYRSVRKLDLSLGQITVVTGSNGTGKSNLYKALHLIAKGAMGELAKTLSIEGGMPSVLWAGPRKSTSRTKAPIRLTLKVQFDEFGYEFSSGLPTTSLSLFSLDPVIKEEYVWWGQIRRPSTLILDRQIGSAWISYLDGGKKAYPLQLSQTESVLSQLQEPHLYPELFKLHDELKKWRFYHHFRTDAESPIRVPQVGVRTPILSHEGHDLAAALQTIIEIGDEHLLYQMIDNAFPGTNLIINVDNKTRFEILLETPGLLRPLEARELSDGTLRYLCLVAALLSPRPASLIALNEPEMSLHPDLIYPLSELILRAAKNSQVWVTTHSQKLSNLLANDNRCTAYQLDNSKEGTVII